MLNAGTFVGAGRRMVSGYKVQVAG